MHGRKLEKNKFVFLVNATQSTNAIPAWPNGRVDVLGKVCKPCGKPLNDPDDNAERRRRSLSDRPQDLMPNGWKAPFSI